MRQKYSLTQKALKEILHYDLSTGKFFWKERSAKHFKPNVPEARQRIWNKGYAGREALTATLNGYKVGMIANTHVKAHRIAWQWMTGHTPEFIDHINGIKDDNRWANLRLASPLENQRNRKLNENNKSGKSGVCWSRKMNKWQAQIKIKNKMSYLGCYVDLQDAIKAREDAEKDVGFHANHGRKSQAPTP